MKVGWEGRGLESAIGKCIATLARPRQPTRRDAMRARCVAARLIDDSGRNAKSATWRPQIDVRCPIHCSDGTIEREHCRTAFLCARAFARLRHPWTLRWCRHVSFTCLHHRYESGRRLLHLLRQHLLRQRHDQERGRRDWLQRCQVATHGGPGQLTSTLTLTSRARYACAARARAIGRAVGLPSDVADVDTAL